MIDAEPGSVATLRGDVAVADLGRVLMHEHVFITDHEMTANYPWRWDEGTALARAAGDLDAAYESGIATIVDLTAPGMGQDIGRLQRAGLASRLNIVVASGFFTNTDVASSFRSMGPRSQHGDATDELVEVFVRDIEVGIATSGVRAGVLKCAGDAVPLPPGVERVLRAVAVAHRQTGVPIRTHSNAAARSGLEQQRILRAEGVDLRRVVIGHCGDTVDLDYLRELADAGSCLGMDRFGLTTMLPDTDRLDVVAALCRSGLAAQLVLSHDANSGVDWTDYEHVRAALPHWRMSRMTSYVLPQLRARGVSDADIETMLVGNPARLLARGRGY